MKENPVRSFIAIPLPASAQETLAQWMQQLKQRQKSGVRWVNANNLHLTLKFLGDVLPSQMPAIQAEIETVAAEFTGFVFDLKDIGAFPGLYKPRVIWAGIQAPPALKEMQKALEKRLKPLGFPPEERPFSPHLTLGRVNRQASETEIKSLSALLREPRNACLPGVPAHALHLYRSDLRPGGPVYTLLYSAALKDS
jgi:2'-5' RNA ligase